MWTVRVRALLGWQWPVARQGEILSLPRSVDHDALSRMEPERVSIQGRIGSDWEQCFRSALRWAFTGTPHMLLFAKSSWSNTCSKALRRVSISRYPFWQFDSIRDMVGCGMPLGVFIACTAKHKFPLEHGSIQHSTSSSRSIASPAFTPGVLIEQDPIFREQREQGLIALSSESRDPNASKRAIDICIIGSGVEDLSRPQNHFSAFFTSMLPTGVTMENK
nr:hypothetical protein CFP56_54387 [Quercus suber]